MKKYYMGPKKRIVASLISREDNKLNFSKKITVIEENVLFYYNFFGVLIEKNTGNVPIRYDELYDLISFDLENSSKASFDFVDEKDLKLVPKNKILTKRK